MNRFQLKKDLEAFGCRLRLREFFYNSDSSDDEDYDPEQQRFKEKSTWNPPKNRDPTLQTYLKAVEKDTWNLSKSKKRPDNLPANEREALTKLRARTDIIIKPADKGSATIVMSEEAYIAEAYRQLTDSRYYHKLDEDPTQDHADRVKDLLQEMSDNGHFQRDTKKYLTPHNPQTARFYHLPKIHKPNIPGRPIVSSCGAPTERISEYIDHHLRPLVTKIPSYLKDTTDFLQKLLSLGPLPQGCILVTLDVSSLYTNIPHNEGIEACQRALQTCPSPAPPTTYLTRMIELILKLNNFSFNDEHYFRSKEQPWEPGWHRPMPTCSWQS